MVRGSADFGISCESCHGAGRDYLQPHQEKGAYEKAIPLGMKDVWKKPDAWVADCVDVSRARRQPDDPKLAAAGHPTGANFTIGTKFTPVAGHWTSKYTANQIAAIGNADCAICWLARRRRRRPRPQRPQPRHPRPAAAAAAAAPAAPAAAGGGAAAPPAAAARPRCGRAGRPARLRSSRAAAPPPGLPSYRRSHRAAAAGAGVRDCHRLPPDPLLPPTPAGIVASLQGRSRVLDDLLRAGATTPGRVTPPARKTLYRGADAELLRLQDEVIALALEALGTPPPAKTGAAAEK